MRFFIILGLLAILLGKPAFSRNVDSLSPSGEAAGSHSNRDFSGRGFPHLLFSQEQLYNLASSRSPNIVAARIALDQRVRSRLESAREDLNVYKGCQIDEYTKTLTYEHGSASRDAADFAIYSVMFSGRQAESARQATIDILTNWSKIADYLLSASNNEFNGFCDSEQRQSQDTRFAVGLTFGRGVPDLVVAYEVLRMQSALTPVQIQQIERFFDALYLIELKAMKYRADNSNLDCNRFNNHVSVQLAALASLAAIRHDRQSLRDIANGSDKKVAISLTTQISKAIYINATSPLKCFSNQINPELYQQVAKINDGEIVDRYRAKPNQTFGYPMFSLEHMLLSVLILEREGIDPTAAEKERLVAALHYYGDLLTQSRTGHSLDAKFRHYQGKNVFDEQHTTDGSDFALNPFIIGAVLFPEDKQIRSLVLGFFERDGSFSHSPSLYLPLLTEIRND